MRAFTFHVTAICLPLVLLAGVLIFAPEHAGAQVAEAWVQRYGNLAGGDDRPTALAVDGGGNVFVTGYSKGIAWDFATIKYSPSGVALWTNRFDGGFGSNDQAFDLAIDTDSNIVVTGTSFRGATSYDWATIKYSNTGVPLWTNYYDAAGKSDSARAVTVDAHGSVFVTGYVASDSGASATVAYSSSGVPLWTNRYRELDYSSGGDIAVGRNGDILVAAFASLAVGGGGGYATIAYSDVGLPLWTNRYSWGSAAALAVCVSGNIIVTGSSGTVAYSEFGLPSWTNSYQGPGDSYYGTAVAADGTGNVYVAGEFSTYGTRRDYVTVAYSNAGLELWSKRYNGPVSGDDSATAVAVDAMGNVYVTGSSMSEQALNGQQDILTIKYSGSGDTLWVARYNGPANGHDIPPTKSIALGPDGAVYVLGASAESRFAIPTSNDYVTIKYVSAPILPTQLTITKNSNWVILGWTNEAFSLQSAPSANGPFTNIPNATSPFPSPISGVQQFYRLKAN